MEPTLVNSGLRRVVCEPFCGIAIGLFYGGGIHQFWIQIIGVGTGFIWAFGTGVILFIGRITNPTL